MQILLSTLNNVWCRCSFRQQLRHILKRPPEEANISSPHSTINETQMIRLISRAHYTCDSTPAAFNPGRVSILGRDKPGPGRVTQPAGERGIDHCFTSRSMANESNPSDFETVPLLTIFCTLIICFWIRKCYSCRLRHFCVLNKITSCCLAGYGSVSVWIIPCVCRQFLVTSNGEHLVCGFSREKQF